MKEEKPQLKNTKMIQMKCIRNNWCFNRFVFCSTNEIYFVDKKIAFGGAKFTIHLCVRF